MPSPMTTEEARGLEDQLSHCDGKDCTCMAHSVHGCACDADWTPAEVYRLRAEVASLTGADPCRAHKCKRVRVEMQAEIERLRAAGTLLSNIAYNMAQDKALPETTRWSLDHARKRWDAAIDAARGSDEAAK